MRLFFNTVILYVFLLSSLLLGGYIVGPVSIRIYVSVVTMIYLIFAGYKFKFYKEVNYYIFFILLYFLALIMNGEISKVGFFKYFFGRYFICFVAIYVIHAAVNTRKSIHRAVFFMVIIGIINSIVTILQFFGNSFALSIPSMLTPTVQQTDVIDFSVLMDTVAGGGVQGLFNSIVDNGYLAGLFAVLSLYLYEASRSKWQKLFYTVIMPILLFAVFLTQQRFITLLVFAYYGYYLYKKNGIFFPVLMLLGLGVGYIAIESSGLSSNDLGRLNDLGDEGRMKIYELGLIFIQENPLFGGQIKFGTMLTNNNFRVVSVHNFFLNAFIYAGIFGGTVLSILFFKMIGKILQKLTSPHSTASMAIGGAVLVYLLNSITHNSSLVTGEEIIWITYILYLKSLALDSSEEPKSEYHENTLRYR